MTRAWAPLRTSFLAMASAGREADDPGPALLQALHRLSGRQAAGQHDMADLMIQADLDELVQLGMHDDEVDAERPVGEGRRRSDLLGQPRRVHRAAGEDAEPAGVADGGHEAPLGDPGHRSAHHREIGAEEAATFVPQAVEAGPARIFHYPLSPGRGRRPSAASAVPAPCTPRR